MAHFGKTLTCLDPCAAFNFPIAEIPCANEIKFGLNLKNFTDIKSLAEGSKSNLYQARLNGYLVVVKMIKV